MVGGNTSMRIVPVIQALHDVTLDLDHGARSGWSANNGAGKSTLLRLLAGIYEPTGGTAVVQGRVAPFDLGVGGMDPEISGYENIIIRGLFLGMSRKQMEERSTTSRSSPNSATSSMPLRTYSTGMRSAWRSAWSRASTPRSCCSTRGSVPSTPPSWRRRGAG